MPQQYFDPVSGEPVQATPAPKAQGGYFNPQTGEQEGAAIPKPPVGNNPLHALRKAETIGAGPAAWQEKADKVLGVIADPKIALPAVATGAAALGTGGMSIPASSGIMAGVNAAATYAGRKLTEWLHPSIPQPPLKDDLLWSAAGGAAPEMLGVLGRGPQIFKRTPVGEEAIKILGPKAGLHEVAEHPVIDFMHNIATAGMGGSRIMQKAKAGRSVEELQALLNKSEEFAPASGAKLLPDLEWQGKDIRDTIIKRKGTIYQGVVKPSYKEFETGGKWGGIPVSLDNTGQNVTTINNLLQERTRIGQMMSELRPDAADYMTRKRALTEQYSHLTQFIEDRLPLDGKTAWEAAKGSQRYFSEIFENPTVQQLLESPTKENEVLSMLFNPQGGGPLGGRKLGTHNIEVNPGGRPTQVSKNNADLLREAQRAMGREEWQHTATAAAQHIIEAATDQNGILDGARLKLLNEAMEPSVKDVLFGGGSKQSSFDNLINVIAETERPPASAAGTLFINIRQGAAIIGTGTAIAGAATGQSSATGSGLVMAGTVMMAPNVMARILTNPTARDWLTKAAKASNPTAKDRLVNMAIKAAAQYGGRQAFKAAGERESKKEQQANFGIIPTPPGGQP